MKILFIGDIVGSTGLRAITEYLPVLKDRYQFDVIIANAENIAPNGRGITKQAAQVLWSFGVNIVTMGNHTWDHDDIYELFDVEKNAIIRPANYPSSLPGKSHTTIKIGSKNVTVVNICGQTFMNSLNCPFAVIDKILCEIPSTHYIIVDFHAEATSEKLAMGHYLAGKVCAVIGTHTHVQTNDAQILNQRTGYITDVGMTGSANGIIGMESESVIKRFKSKLPVRLKVDNTTNGWQFSAVIIETDSTLTNTLTMKIIKELS